MKWKITAQTIAERMAKEKGISKRSADTFMRAFVETLEEGLQADGTVKIEGFGTFKTVSMGSRESVNVTNGVRMTISGYTKVAFTPADSITALLTQRLSVASVSPSTERGTSEIPAQPAAASPVPAPVSPDAAANFDAIDDIIATPESEMPAPAPLLSDTATKAVPEARPVAETPQAAENVAPKAEPSEPQAEQPTAQPAAPSQPTPSSSPAPEAPVKGGGESGNQPGADGGDGKKPKKRHFLWIAVACCVVAVLLMAVLYLGTNKTQPQPSSSSPATETPQDAPQRSTTATHKAQPGTADSTVNKAAATASPAGQTANATRPKTYTLQRGQSLTDVSVMFYHTKDSVRALIRANNFLDPNNIYIGTVIKLP